MSESLTAATNASEYTVSEISGALKRTVEDTFGNVRVRGEISGYRGPHSSGHAYFALKDDRARIEAVVWKGTFGRLKFRPEEGMEVIAQGKLTTYPGSSKYQIVIDSLEPAGAGALMALLEDRKRRLAAEGLFEAARKRRLPYMPGVIGVVTSPTGSVIRDIIHRIADRFPLHVIVWPVRVQGETTGAEVSAAVAGFNALAVGGEIPRPDVLIVARGGGSLEDLWGFNDEAVVRAVAASEIPVISAVGHETDWTLIDLAADLRAPTPTGAAELAVPVRIELEATLAGLSARLAGAISRSTDGRRQTLRAAARALPSADQLLALPRRRFDELAGRIDRALSAAAAAKRSRFQAARLSPIVLRRAIGDARRHLDAAGARLNACASASLRQRASAFEALRRRSTPEPLVRAAGLRRERLVRETVQLDRAVLKRLGDAARRFEALDFRLRPEVIGDRMRRRRERLDQIARLLASVSYEKVLERGFALVADADGSLIRRASEIQSGARLSLRFADGTRLAQSLEGDPGEAAAVRSSRPARASGRRDDPGRQGDLF